MASWTHYDADKREAIQLWHQNPASLQFTETMMLYIMLERARAVRELWKILSSSLRMLILSPTGGDIDVFGNLPHEV